MNGVVRNTKVTSYKWKKEGIVYFINLSNPKNLLATV
jgi:hypothetical protein